MKLLYLIPVLLLLEVSEGQQWFSNYRPQINSFIGNPMMMPRSECFTSADNRAGMCMSKKSCAASGGISAGSCGVIGTCCIYQGSCRSVVNANESYFVSPSFPNTQVDRLDPPICIFTLQRDNLLHKWQPVCQIRVDFDEFTLAPPVNGSCSGLTDSFVVSGAANFNTSGLPESGICGDMSGQHMYFNVDSEDVSQPLLLVINAANDRMFNRKWSIRIRQIACASAARAPSGCLQYHTASTGVIESFNFRGFSQLTTGNQLQQQPAPGVIPSPGSGQNALLPSPKYMSNLKYGVCVSQQALVCGIRWQASDFDLGGNRIDLSGVGASTPASNFGCSIHSGGGLGDQGDYVLIPAASRDGVNDLEHMFCGQKLHPLPDQNTNAPLVSFMKPFVVYVRTDASPGNPFNGPQNQKGFQIQYQTIPCS